MISIPESVINEVSNYSTKVSDYKNGKIDSARFKAYRVSMGVYEQRDSETYMVRPRIPSGVLTLDQFKKIQELTERYGKGYIHFTTRQDIQFHNVTLENTVNIIEELWEVGIISRGTGGNTVRNVACSPLSGVSQDEIFDVTEYAEETTSYLLKDPTALNLPRKYKIAFSNSNADTANATISDLGFIAKTQDNKKGFEVYGAGGLGGSSTASLKLEEFIPANEILYHVQAMKEIFESEGDRTNKNKARIRFIRYRFGDEEFFDKYKKQVEKVKLEKKLDINVCNDVKSVKPENLIEVKNTLKVEQRSKGVYSIYIHPQNGNLTIQQINKIISFIDNLPYEISIRLTNTQGFYIRDLKENDAEEFLKTIKEFTSDFDIDNSVACAGASTCKLGLCLSQNLLIAIKNRFENVEHSIKSQLPRIFISGCPNSCGQHQKGEIGLAGKAKRTDKGLIPAYTIYMGGRLKSNSTSLGDVYGDIPAKILPEFLFELAKLKATSKQEAFINFLEEEAQNIRQLINKLSVSALEKDDLDLYMDFGSEEKFSLEGRGPGECSAGVLDVIKLDISNAETDLQEYIKTKQSIKLYKSSISASRALLILKGIDTAKDRVILSEFKKQFVKTGYVRDSVNQYLEDLIDFKIGDLESLENNYDNAKYLVERVKDMYQSLSPQLEITIKKENDNLIQVESEKTDSTQIINLKGVKCPINFVKAKIEISKIASGEQIGFYLDDGDPIQNVPRSIEGEGHEILSVDNEYEGFNLLKVKKK